MKADLEENKNLYFPNYDWKQLESMAEELNMQYDASRLAEPKPIDVYDIVDLLGARIAFEYLSPDRTYLGATIFKASELYVWPSNPFVQGMMPEKKIFYGGTIIIDRDLSERKTEQDKFIENFTVMHECFHFDKHDGFVENHVTLFDSISKYRQIKTNGNSYERWVQRSMEWQANYAAAAFLMPQNACIQAAKELLDYKGECLAFGYKIKPKIQEVGILFGVNYSPMSYRLQDLGILSPDFDSTL